jgi:DNA-binding transcriptional LysR family regulator
MENFRLKVFRTVAEKQSFRQAAEVLYLTQPAVTLQVKALEDEIGLQVFDRSCKIIQLTDAGARLLQYAQEIAILANAALRDLASLKDAANAELQIGVSTTIAQYVFFKFAAEFVKSNPTVRLRVVSGNTHSVVQSLLDGVTSLGLVEGPARQALLKREVFLKDEIVAIVPAGHPWQQQVIALDQLTRAPLIFREEGSGTRWVVESALKRAGVSLRDLKIAMQMNSTESIKAAVEAGMGVGFASQRAIEKEIRLGTLTAVTLEKLRFHREFTILYPRGSDHAGNAGAFLDFLRRISRESRFRANY